MSVLFRVRGRVVLATLILAALVFIGAEPALPAQAEGGFALSGSFYAQELEMPQGSRLDSPEVYVVVFNNSDADFKVRMTTEAPLGVTLIPSEDDFALSAGQQRQISVSIEVASDAVPGEHKISVTAEPYREGAQGIQIIGAAGQTASLTIVGDSAGATVQVVSPDGAPVTAVVSVSKVLGEALYEVAHSETGQVQARLAPGSYLAAAYVGGELLAKESFDLAPDEEKTVTLTVRTIYFEGFGLVPSYRSGTDELGFLQVVYTVKNLYKPMDSADVVLLARYNEEAPEENVLATLSPLELGRVGLNYSYIPAAGWRPGTYTLWLELRVGGRPYTSSSEEQLVVGDRQEPPQTAATAAAAATAAPVSVAQQPPVSNTMVYVLLGIVAVPVVGAGAAIVVRGRTDSKRYW